MEPQGRPLTPGTSYGPPSCNSAQSPVTATFPDCTLKSSCSPKVRDGLMPAKDSWDLGGEEESEQTEGDQPGADPESTQRRLRSSAFPSSLSWDSDSERETPDEEELQHFSNPHGLAAHSPGSPSSGLRLTREDDQEPENLQLLHSRTDSPSPVQGHDESTKTHISQLGPIEHSTVWNVSERAELLLAKVKPKDNGQKDEEADNSEGEKQLKGEETTDPGRDVYSFHGDSDPESPPPAPWAHCTFIQRCRKKRVLLRPFSGLGTLKHTLPEPGKQARVSPQKSKAAESAQLNEGGGVYNFEEANFGEGAVKEPLKFRDRGGTRERAEETEVEPGREIFTCVECSIYFKKQVHLQEHIVEHCQSGVEGGGRSGKGGGLPCDECGWNLPNGLALADHHRRHQESRRKILAEIEKLNENGKAREIQKLDSKMVKCIRSDQAFMQDASKASVPDKESDPDAVAFPPASPARLSAPGPDPAALDSDAATPHPAGAPPQARGVSCRRRFICTKCNFSTRTSQALANHTKTHNRKKPAHHADSPPSGSPPRLASTSLACGHCAFLTSSQTVMREHQRLVHPAGVSISRAEADETGQRSRVPTGAQISDQSSASRPNKTPSKNKQGVTASDGSTVSDGPAAQTTSQVVFKCVGSRTFRMKGTAWTDDPKLSGSEEEEHNEGRSAGLDTDCSQQEASSPVGVRRHTRARSHTGDYSVQQSTGVSLPPKKSVSDRDKPEVEKDGKVFFLRRRNRVTAASAEIDSDDDDDDDDDDDNIVEERVQRFLSEGILDEDDDIEDDVDALRSVERKCPYCPDRFHNGIGLANHVRGHLNRVGVSYNVRHFISPEEVNAIEKKFSYQKKKKKVANFDPDTFSVMHCEFCSAGFDTRAGLSSHARAHLRDFGITNWDVTISPIHILRELFSSRPDLVIPTAPPRSPGSSLEEGEEEEQDIKEEEEGVIGVKLKGGTSERTLGVATSDAQPPESPQHLKEEDKEDECEGEEEEAAEEEEDEEELQLLALDGLSSSPWKTGLCSVDADGLSAGEDADFKGHDLKCEVCGAQCETRRGLSIHARSHSHQLGIRFSETNGAPIDLLYQIAKERNVDSQTRSPLLEPLSSESSSPSAPQKDEDLEDMNLDQKPIPLSVLAKATKAAPPSSSTPSPGASPAPPLSASLSPLVRKAPISSLLPVSSPLRSSEYKAGGIKSLTANLSTPTSITAKPLWAPQENDAPLNLTLDVDPDKDIICQLCGAWFETRKGLSSHARAHLRHFGVEYSESKGSPIDLMNQLVDTDEFKHKASALQLDGPPEPLGLTTTLSTPKQSSLLSLSSSSSSSSLLYKVATAGGGSTSKATSAASLLGPPAKRLKSSSMRVYRLSNGELMALPHSEPPKEIGCEFCGEYFENRKGLSSHARSHLRQMGITEWSVNGSPIDTLRDIITRRGLPCALPLKRLKTPPSSSPGPRRSPLSTSSPPSATLLSRLPFAFARPSSPPQPAASKSSSAPRTSSGGLILKMKPEPVQLEVTTPGPVGRADAFSGGRLSWSSSDSVFPLNLAMAHEAEPTRDIRCEFCGEYFENRKGLSSHARSHLRQMGITEWSVNGSPIDTLREVMHKRGAGASPQSVQGVKKESSRGASSPLWENTGTGTSDGLNVSGYKSSKFHKSCSLLQSGLRLHKQGLGSVGTSATPPGGKYFRISPLGKRSLSEEAQSVETGHSPPHQLKAFSPLPQDFSFKRKPSPDKQGHQDPSCELCGFFFENRKALASHARAHLRQFGVTEWSVNGSPIETLSAWMRTRPQKLLEMHRSYMQGNRSTLKKKGSSPLAASTDSDHILPISPQKASSSSSQWPSSLALSPVRSLSCEVSQGSSKTAECEAGTNLLTAPIRPGRGNPSLSRLAGGLSLKAQVVRSELNVRLPRGLERRPLKHPSCPDGTERDGGSPKPPRTGTVPALVPKPPSYPLVKLVGKFYTLKCRFCEVEFHGPLSVQEDWIRHIQQHILKMNYNKPAAPKDPSAVPPAPAGDPIQASAPASTSTSSTTSTTPALASALTCTTVPSSCSPTPPAECATPVSAPEIVKVLEEQPIPSPPSIAPPTQTV